MTDKIEEVKKILETKMALERCDPDVMPYFTDYYWIPRDEVGNLAKQINQLYEQQPEEDWIGKPTFYQPYVTDVSYRRVGQQLVVILDPLYKLVRS